jgi:hypothetical protein
MSVALPPNWDQSKSVPTSEVTILGVNGATVATITVTGTVNVATVYPYKMRSVTT